MEFTFELSWPALFLIMIAIGMVIEKKETKKVNNIDVDNSLRTVKEYHQYIEKFLNDSVKSNQSLATENETLKKRVHTMETRSTGKAFGHGAK